jgi:hypothetical protein
VSYEYLQDQAEETDIRNKNDRAWDYVFSGCHVLDQINEFGKCYLKADDLKKYGHREPRLMAKIESKDTVPKVLEKNQLCVLPYETRGNYIIGHFDAFLDVDYSPDHLEIKPTRVDRVYDTLDPYNISKEPSAILSAFNYGILDEIAGNPITGLKLTNFGRESSAEFEYCVNNTCGGAPYRIHVNGSQLEMDGVFESDDCIVNIEAKIGIRDNFLARQLYYPYRLIRNKTEKEILNVFLAYSGGSIFTHTFVIDEPSNYNSFRLIENRRFDFFEEISVSDILDVLKRVRISDDPVGIPFPQADSMQKVLDASELIGRYPGITYDDLAYKMSVTERQGSYYGNACEYLGLTERKRHGGAYHNWLSGTGRDFMSLSSKARIMKIIELVAKHETFNHFLNEYLEQNRPPERKDIIEWLIDNINGMNAEAKTPSRRASTVMSWIDWIIGRCSAD